MIVYLLKIIVCSAVLLAGYLLFLQKEKMNHFKRFYLLLSLLFSYTVPLLIIRLPQHANPVTEKIIIITAAAIPTEVIAPTQVLPADGFSFSVIALWLYMIITTYLLYRFVRNLLLLLNKTRNNEIILYKGVKLVLVNDAIIPFSFLNYIFISASAYNEGRVDEAILNHEMAHVQQQHSVDIIILELLRVWCWFNPFLYGYKKAMQLNHEFLADDNVVNNHNDIAAYQYLLINTASVRKATLLTSQFNFLTTKKRLIMMTKKTSRLTFSLKLLLTVLVAIGMGYIFSTRVVAQDKRKSKSPAPKEVSSTTEGVSQELLDEYASIVSKYRVEGANHKFFLMQNVPASEIERLNSIYIQMSKTQQEKQVVAFIPQPGILPRVVPTEKQFESWKDASKYGVWINEKKVKNTVLSNFSNADFAQANVSKLYGAAKRNVTYFFQVNLMTKDYYENYKAKAAMDTGNMMVTIYKLKKENP